jgi:hypothetical protein
MMEEKVIMELPVLAIDLRCYNNEHLRLMIDEVFGFPNEIAYGGGYGVRGRIDIQVGPYNVHASHCFTTGELYDFYCQLQKCYDSVSGEAILTNTEQELELKLSFDKSGKVFVIGQYQARLDISNRLCFNMITDQTYLSEVLVNLKNVYKKFGDKRGVI